jgi:hypothetical protein
VYKQQMDPKTATEASHAPDSSLLRPLAGGVVAALIALACILPPLVHIATGPLGPAIGGFVVAQRVRPDSRGIALLAGSLGLTLAGLFGGGMALAVRHLGQARPDWFPSPDLLGAIAGGVWLYGTALGALGASLGARSKGKEPPAST